MPATITFLIGRAGSGKSRRVEQALKTAMAEGRRAVMFVPEQFTYEAERGLSARLGGLLGIQVLSFTRLCERVLSANARPFLSGQGRRMVMRRAAYRAKSQLTAFAPVALRPGFAQRMDEIFALCKRFLIAPEDLQKAASAMQDGNPLKEKLEDMALLFSKTQAYLDERYLDSEDAFHALYEALPGSFLAGADIYVDGFDLLTTQLLTLFERLMEVCNSITFTILMDPQDQGSGIFAPERRAYDNLMEIANRLGARTKRVALKSLAPDTPMRHLERYLLADDILTYPGPAPEVTVYAAASRVDEVEAMADNVLKIAKTGVRFREMTVIAGDMPSYAALVQRAFAKRDIPVFLDARREMQGHPAVELLLSAVRAAVEGFPAAELFRISKTGLCGLTEDEAEVFENYVLRYGLRGRGVFSSPFEIGEVPPLAEDAREKIITPLLTLREGLAAPDAAGKTKAVYEYLTALHVYTQLTEETERLKQEGRYTLMQEHAQVWNVIVELMDQLYTILGDSPVSRAEYLSILEDAVCAYQVGIIPATADQVLLGTITRTRSRNVRALFVLGCNEGVLPGAHLDDGIIDDGELSAMSGLGLAPWGDSRRRAQNDLLDIYRAFSRASEYLFVGYACASGKEELLPSFLVQRIRELFPGRTEPETLISKPRMPESAPGGFQTLVELLRDGRDEEPLTQAMLAYYGEQPAFRGPLKKVLEYRSTPVSPPAFGPALATRLYGQKIETSYSQLHAFNTCPFRHFMEYGLKARPRREFRDRPEPTDAGTFCHEALEAFVKAVGGRDWAKMTPEDVDAILDEVLPGCLNAYQDGLLCSTPRGSAIARLWLDIVRHTAHAVTRQIAAGSFRPVQTEVRFAEHALFPPIRLQLEDGRAAVISGTIDRLDAARDENGETYVAVVDYKTGSQELNYAGILAGIQLQLPLYLMAVENIKQSPAVQAALGIHDVDVAGMFYQPVKLPKPDEDPGKVLQSMRLNGLVIEKEEAIRSLEHSLGRTSKVVKGISGGSAGARGDALISPGGLNRLMEYTKRRATDTLALALAGETAAAPLALGTYDACSGCAYKSVCRFDLNLPGCKHRYGKNVKQDEFLKLIGVDAQGGET